MKLKYIFIPAILITILVVGICKHYYNLDLLSMNHVCMISIASFIAFFTIFFGIYVCAYEAAKRIAEQQDERIDKYFQCLGQLITKYFEVSDILTKDVVTAQSLKVIETMKELALTFNEGDDTRAKVLSNLLVDIKSVSVWARDNSLAAKNASSNCEKLANEAIERLDNVLISLRGDNVEDIKDDEIRVVRE